MLPNRLPPRFWQWLRADPDGCWRWTGAHNNVGYAQFWHQGRMRYPHRLAYEAFIGLIGIGLTIDHLCRTRDCANPLHLDAVTLREYVRRGVEARRLETHDAAV